MDDRPVRFTEEFFTRLELLLPEDRDADGTPSISDFLVFDIPPIRDKLARHFVNETLPTDDPRVRQRCVVGLALPCGEAGELERVCDPPCVNTGLRSGVVNSARRSQLLAVKLMALVRDHTGIDGKVTPGGWLGGAALLRDDEAWVLAEDQPERALGRALAWARQHHVGRVHVLAERATGLLARRASYFAIPPSIWHVDGRTLIEAVAEPFPIELPIDPELTGLRNLIVEGGAEPVEEHGVLMGEVEGLEVCRAVRDPFTGVCRLEVGVGTHDREAFQLMHGDIPTVEALGAVADIVAEHRRPGAALHPLNRLGAERALRSRLIAAPDLVGAVHLGPAPPPVPRANLKDPVPCVAVGSDRQGDVVVVCSTGIDLDVVPFAADARAALRLPAARLVIAVPARDAVDVTTALAQLLTHPAEVVGL